MKELLSRSWWMLALRGILALVFGALALAWPGVTLLWIVAVFAAYALLSGIAAIVGSVQHHRVDRGWWLPFLLGIVSVLAAIGAIAYPGITLLVLVLFVGFNAIFTGALDIVTAVRLRRVMRGEWLLALAGVASIVFGGLLIALPAVGAIVLAWMIAVWALVTGVLLLVLAFRARDWDRGARPGSFHHAPAH